MPDLYLPWIPVAWLAARSEARRADLIISTGGASAHIVAQLLEGSKPTVVDINDLWWRNPRRDSGPNRDRVDRWLEKRIISRATALIVPVAEQGDEVARRWGRPSTAVPTGFDPSDFGSPETNAAPRSAQHEILFAGTLYENFQVNLIFEALVAGRETYGWSPERLRVVFIGSGSGKALSVARAYGIGEFVGGVPPMSRHELMNRLVAADALLLPLYAEDPHHLPMRFFEFVGAGRPLIGIGSADVPAGKLLRTHGLGPVCETVEDLVAAFEHVASNSRLPELPSATRALFDVTRSKPALQGLIDDVMAPDVGRNA